MRRTTGAIYAITAVLSLTASAHAQTPASLMTGRLVDESTRAPIHHGVIRIGKTNHRVLTDSLGNFVLSGIKPGSHTLTASALGYREITVSATPPGPVLILITPEPVPIAAVRALARARDLRMPGAIVKVFGRDHLLEAGDISVASFVSWKTTLTTLPCHVVDTLGIPEWVGAECIVGPRGTVAPVRVLVDDAPVRYSNEMWGHQTWDLGRVEVVYQRTSVAYPFRPSAVIRIYTLPYLARTAGRLTHICDRVAAVDSIAREYLTSLCRQ
jgi:hypothetical protein